MPPPPLIWQLQNGQNVWRRRLALPHRPFQRTRTPSSAGQPFAGPGHHPLGGYGVVAFTPAVVWVDGMPCHTTMLATC